MFLKQIMNMKTILINSNDSQEQVKLTLTMQDIKMLHNLCCDTVNEYPEMIGYEKLAKKLNIIIDSEKIMSALDELFADEPTTEYEYSDELPF